MGGGVSEFDAILVGAGHNSLACAAHLALKGWKVAVFERNGRLAALSAPVNIRFPDSGTISGR